MKYYLKLEVDVDEGMYSHEGTMDWFEEEVLSGNLILHENDLVGDEIGNVNLLSFSKNPANYVILAREYFTYENGFAGDHITYPMSGGHPIKILNSFADAEFCIKDFNIMFVRTENVISQCRYMCSTSDLSSLEKFGLENFTYSFNKNSNVYNCVLINNKGFDKLSGDLCLELLKIFQIKPYIIKEL
jgi:hypothetical protein